MILHEFNLFHDNISIDCKDFLPMATTTNAGGFFPDYRILRFYILIPLKSLLVTGYYNLLKLIILPDL